MPAAMAHTVTEVLVYLADYASAVRREMRTRNGPPTAHTQACRDLAALGRLIATELGYNPVAEAKARAQTRQRIAGNAPDQPFTDAEIDELVVIEGLPLGANGCVTNVGDSFDATERELAATWEPRS